MIDDIADTKEMLRAVVKRAIADNTEYINLSPHGYDDKLLFEGRAAEQAANEIYGKILHWKGRAERAEAKLRAINERGEQ